MYPLTLDLIDFLQTDRAQSALDALRDIDLHERETLRIVTDLRKNFTQAEAAVLLDQARLRQRAHEKFPDAQRLYFTDEALQQASSYAVASYRAKRFVGYSRVADLGSGVGADTMTLAEVVPEVIAVELNPVRARLLGLNLTTRSLNQQVQVKCADWTLLNLDVDAAFIDPGRRQNGRRVFSLHEMEPPISAVQKLRARIPNIAVKVMPGIQDEEVPPGAAVEFISEAGTLKEALLLFGDLRPKADRTATLLPGEHQLDSSAPTCTPEVSKPLNYLYEPDPAVIRAGLVRQLAVQINAAQIDSEIAYLTASTLQKTPFARAWQILQSGPFHLKTLNRWLQALQAGEVIIKKRGFAVDPDVFRKKLKPKPQGLKRTVFLTRVDNHPWMVIGVEVKEHITNTS